MELKTHKQLLRVDPNKGVAITHLSLIGNNGELRSIIEPDKDYKFESSLLFPFPNRLENGAFEFEGKEYRFPFNDFGRPNALHGMVHEMRFNCIKETENRLIFELSYDGHLDFYPFPFILTISYLLKEGALDIQVGIENQGDESMPCGFGWHPYFNLSEGLSGVKLRMNNVTKVDVNERFIPTGKQTPYHAFDQLKSIKNVALDNCFIFPSDESNKLVFLAYKDKSVLEVWQDKHLSFVQVFIPPNKKAIAIEPMTCGINALNTKHGLKVLNKAEHWTLRFGLRYT